MDFAESGRLEWRSQNKQAGPCPAVDLSPIGSNRQLITVCCPFDFAPIAGFQQLIYRR